MCFYPNVLSKVSEPPPINSQAQSEKPYPPIEFNGPIILDFDESRRNAVVARKQESDQ
jgi:hypothetical protein